MAFKRWLGRAGAVAEVHTVTISTGAGWGNDDTITLTINGKDLVITVQTLLTNPQIATTVQEAWENLTFTDTTATKIPADGGQGFAEHAEITATVSGSVVTLTHDTDGTPFTLTVATSDTGGIATITLIKATGPNHWDDVDNWEHESGNDLPGVNAGDEVIIENSDVSILYQLNQFSILNDLTSLTIARNYTGDIGLPRLNAGGYVEYRTTYLKIPVGIVTIGRGEGSGSGRIKLDTHDDAAAVLVVNTGSGAESGELEALLLKGANVANTLTVLDGSVAVAAFDDDVAELASLLVTAGSVRVGKGVGATIATVKNVSGNVSLYSDVTTVTNSGGTLLLGGTAAMTTVLLQGGTCRYASSANIGTLTIGGPVGAIFDASLENSARTITTLNVKPNMRIDDPLRTLTYTNIAFDSDTRSWLSS